MKVSIKVATAIGIIFAEVVEGESTAAAMMGYLTRSDVAAELSKLRYAGWCVQADMFDPLPDARVPGAEQVDVARWRQIEAERAAAAAGGDETWRDEIAV